MKEGVIVTYAQYNEDIILKALLHDVKKGFYVDVGASSPDELSVTKLFYIEGWNGVNIEPLPSKFNLLKQIRKRDTNLNIGIGTNHSKLTLREYIDGDGLSTFSDSMKNEYAKSNSKIIKNYKDHVVEVLPLKDVLKSFKTKIINFIKIDVEGFEYEVVASNDWQKYRPSVICIEANHIQKDWKRILISNNYKLFISDGLNEYYIANEDWYRTEGFAERIAEFTARLTRPILVKQNEHLTNHYEHLTRNLEGDNKRLVAENRFLKLENSKLSTQNRLTLSNRKYFSRLKRAAYGLTVDWVKFKKNTKK